MMLILSRRLLWILPAGLYLGRVRGGKGAAVTPLSIPPSQSWDGIDGQWSTFHVEVGTPGKAVRLIPGTSANAGTTFWVITPDGCSAHANLPDCSMTRGSLFSSNESSTWADKGLYSLTTAEESLLNLNGSGDYGLDTVSLGLQGSGLPTLQDQVIAGIIDDNYRVGSLGLSPVAHNFSDPDSSYPSMLANLRNQSLIPSLSWGYTAGAIYHDPSIFGSLTLGGYDMTRLIPNNVSFAFGSDSSRDLLVGLQSITYDGLDCSPLLEKKISIFIDSMVTDLWLPVDVCQAFQNAFDLDWDSESKRYLVSDEAHAALIRQNSSISFTFSQAGAESDAKDTVVIELPYAAFDLNFKNLINGSVSRYFPLKQASDNTQYTLGRAFLQQAYIIADYDRRNFSVSQALFPPTSVSQDIVAMLAPRDQGPSNPGLKKYAIALIVVGSIAVLCTAIAASICLAKRHRRRTDRARYLATSARNPNYSAMSPVLRMDSLHDRQRDDGMPRELQAPLLPTHELGQNSSSQELQGQPEMHELASERRVLELHAPLSGPGAHELG